MDDPRQGIDRRRHRLILACAAFATFMGTLDEFIVGISLPTIARYFSAGTGAAVWVVLIYFLMVTGTLILFGKLADRKGLKRLFVAGYVVFLLGSLLCGVAWSMGALVGARAIQGVGGSILRVVAYAIVAKLLPREVRGWGYGALSTASASGIMVGAPVGGLISGLISWRWIFLVNIPIGLVAILAVVRVLPKDEKPAANGARFDLPGAALSFLGLGALTYALNMGHEEGWASPAILACLGGAAILFILFVRRELAISDPMLDLRLFRSRPFVFGNLALFMTCMFMSGDGFLFPFFLQLARGLDASVAGLVLLLYSVVYVPAAQLAGRLSDRIQPAALCTLAALSGTLACLFFVASMSLPSLWPAIVYMVWAAVSCAMFISPCNNSVMSHAPEDRQGSASGILSTANQLSGVIGVCVFELLFSLPADSAGIHQVSQLQSSPALLMEGFRYAYLGAPVVCLAAAACAFLARTRTQGWPGKSAPRKSRSK